jgi:HD-GYP domain-containing protein (c-di-GMP phosphodiesterase class II)
MPTHGGVASGGVCLAELVAAMSLATDLGLGQPMQHVLRSSLVGLRMAEALGLDEAERSVVYYVGLLASVGCHADSYEVAALFGDDIAARADGYRYDLVGTGLARYIAGHLGAGGSLLDRARALASFTFSGVRSIEEADSVHCLIAGDFALRLGLGDDVYESLQHCFERWDGKGKPGGIHGEEQAISARIVQVAETTVAWHHLGGMEAAVEVARRRRGSQFDPRLVDLLCQQAPSLLAQLDEATWQSIIDAEPALRQFLSDRQLDVALEAVGDFADLKSPYFSGHSRNVARLAGDAGSVVGLPPAAATRVRRAGLLSDLGRVGVPNTIWDKKRPLSQSERERIRLHPYLGERVLAQSPALAELGQLAALHHERLDGSGYPYGLAGEALSIEARLLAAADCFQALVEPRPHRPAFSADETERVLRSEVLAGRLDGDTVNGVLSAAGRRIRRRRQWPAGLTPREVEVLRHLSRGASTKEIADNLAISPKTVGSHIEHIYVKTGTNSRAAVTMYAMKHGLLEWSGSENRENT